MKTILDMLNRIFSILFVFFAFTMSLYGQDNFISGQVITTQGEEKNGQINFLDWGANPRHITFKSEGKTIQYTPSDIKSFSLENGELYESYTVKLPKISNKAHQIIYTDSIKKVNKQVFLRVEVKGVYNLLSYKEANDAIHFFIQKEVQSPVELIYEKTYAISDEGQRVYRVDESYKRQLNFYFSDCDQFYSKILETKYTRQDMKSLFKKYSFCKGTSIITYESKKERGKINVYPILGISLSTLSIGGPGVLKNVDARPSLLPSIGGGFEFVMPRNLERWSLKNEWILKGQIFSDIYSENVFANFTDTYQIDIAMVYLKMNSMAKGKLLVKKWAPFVQIGVSNGLALNFTNKVDFQRFDEGVLVDEDTFPLVNPLKNYEFGVLSSLGLEYNNQLSFEIRYEYSDGFTKTFRSSSHVETFYLLASYKFGIRK